MDMSRKIAIVTGASRGIGRSIAIHLARQHIDVIGTYRSRRDRANEVAKELHSIGGRAAMLQFDASTPAQFGIFAERVGETLSSTFGRTNFEFLINNAGGGIFAPYAQTTEAQFDEMVSVQLKTPFFLTQTLLPRIVDGGRILNVSSGLARFTLPGWSAYAATKGAVEVLTRYMAIELGNRKIRVNVIAPGATETDFGGGVVRDNPDVNHHVTSQIALGRVGLPDDIGAAVAAILSDGFGWSNGGRIEVSGGQNL
jgi:NAD(P)-dependent dehydrogenase (short-subunit alcohol dehydrogenase family)